MEKKEKVNERFITSMKKRWVKMATKKQP